MPPQVGINVYISKLRNMFKNKMISKGYDPKLVELALRLADRWIKELAMYYSNGLPWLYTAIYRAKYIDALRVAERWLEEVSK